MKNKRQTKVEVESKVYVFIKESPNLWQHFFSMDKALLVREIMKCCLRESNRARRMDSEVKAYLQKELYLRNRNEKEEVIKKSLNKKSYRPIDPKNDFRKNGPKV